MITKISNDLKKEEIWANGDELANIMGLDRVKGKRVLTYPEDKKIFVYAFSNPVLVTDNYRISKLKPKLRDTLFSLSAIHPKMFEYDGVIVKNETKIQGVWSPSIDTALFAKGLKDLFEKRKKFEKCIEIGTGSGFLSKYCLEKNKEIKSFVVNDLNPYAIECAMKNIKDKRVVFYKGNGTDKLKGEKYDLIICNPPYIPRPDSIDDNPYEGVGLLYDLIHNGQNYLNKGGVLITNISSLCWDIISKQKPKMEMKILEKMDVPLKVNNVMNNKEWISYLEKRGMKKKMKKGYEYWQKIVIVTFQNE